MSEQNKLAYAQELYDNKKYTEAVPICLELLDVEGYQFSAATLGAKSVIGCLNHCKNEKINELLEKFVDAASYAATNLEEITLLCEELSSAFKYWKYATYLMLLDTLKKDPTMDLHMASVQFLADAGAEIQLNGRIIELNTDAKLNSLLSDDPKVKKEFFSNHFKTSDPKFEKIKYDTEYETAVAIFDDVKGEIPYQSMNYNEALFTKVYNELYVAENLIGKYDNLKRIINKKDIQHDYIVKCLVKEAEIITFRTTVIVHGSNGKRAYAFASPDQKRMADISKIEAIYTEIKKLDPDFVPPQLPSKEPLPVAPEKKSGCYVATAVYGSYDCPQVWTLRRFRDYTLAETWYGRAFIKAYYTISPTLVKWFGDTEWFKNLWKPTLDHMVKKLNNDGVNNTPYNDRPW